MRAWPVLLLCLLPLGCSSGGAETASESASRTTQPIAGGKLDETHSNVFLLASHYMHMGGLCTSTLIAPNLLLTARHCVSPNTGDESVLCGASDLGVPYPPSAFAATNDAQPNDSSHLFFATDVRVPDSGSDTCGYDIALLILSQNVPASLASPAVPRIDREAEPGEVYTAVGYGENDAGLPIATRIEREGLKIECEPGRCGEGVESTEFLGETGICSGDSGGPALDADGKVVGVVSRGGRSCGSPVYGSVSSWYDLIIATAKDAAAQGSYEPPFWVTTGVSDPIVVEGAGGADGAAGAPASEPGSEGTSCSTTTDCQSGLYCSDEPTPRCARPAAAGESGGCSLSPESRGSAPSVLLLAGLASLAALSRRRAAPARTAGS
ncbi:MAG TPA: S1 family peptidase [Polyangiaceae bacterium]|nr:S1 family peptidase [Polyangiaceae bacterium]